MGAASTVTEIFIGPMVQSMMEHSLRMIFMVSHYTWSDKREYNGQWSRNQMHGTGLFTWSDGRTYEGAYNNDQKHGRGVFKWPDGRVYDGQWKSGKQHGSGTYISAETGEKRAGEWENGQRLRWT